MRKSIGQVVILNDTPDHVGYCDVINDVDVTKMICILSLLIIKRNAVNKYESSALVFFIILN